MTVLVFIKMVQRVLIAGNQEDVITTIYFLYYDRKMVASPSDYYYSIFGLLYS